MIVRWLTHNHNHAKVFVSQLLVKLGLDLFSGCFIQLQQQLDSKIKDDNSKTTSSVGLKSSRFGVANSSSNTSSADLNGGDTKKKIDELNSRLEQKEKDLKELKSTKSDETKKLSQELETVKKQLQQYETENKKLQETNNKLQTSSKGSTQQC